MTKLSNDEKVKRIEKRRILLWLIIFFGIATIALSILSLTIRISPIFAIVAFLIEAVLSKYRTKLDPRLEESDSKNQE